MVGVTATIRDVAERAGVSIATVSRVMNDRPDVGVDTRGRVLDAARDLGYVAHGPARALSTSRSQLMGVVMPPGVGRPEVALTFFGEVIDSVTRHLDDHGYDGVLLHSASHGHPYPERARLHSVAGLLLLGSVDPGDLAQVPPSLPCVGVDTRLEGPNRGSVIFDDVDGIRLSVRHLYALGHRRLAYLGGPTRLRPARDRLEAFLAEVASLGIEALPEHVREGDWSGEAGYREACAVLAAGAERPTAIVAASDLTALSAMQALRDFGLRPGEDVAVTGFDDLPMAAVGHPPLTTIRQDRERLGAAAVTALVELLDRPDEEGPQLVLPVSLVVRASTARAA
jgi:LacI family transcriptional regulator